MECIQDVPVIRYSSGGRVKLLNHWQDRNYFTGAFPTLFPVGDGGHEERRQIQVSMKGWGQFLLNHHSRRFARHGTFLYLLYDVLRICDACLGNSLYAKRRNWDDVKAVILRLTPERLTALAEEAANGRASQIFDADV